MATKKTDHSCHKAHKQNRKPIDWVKLVLMVYMVMSAMLQGFLLYMVITQQNLIDELACNFLSLAQSVVQLIGQ